MKVLIGFALGTVVAIAIPLFVLATGSFNVAATTSPGMIEKALAPWALNRSLLRRAPRSANPVGASPSVLGTGLAHYRENCVSCHGAPGVEAAELAKGLNPAPPMLDTPSTQRRSDGELFWVIKNGIRMTGMPAFGPTHGDPEIWKVVAFLRHIDKLTPEERATLRSATEQEEHHRP